MSSAKVILDSISPYGVRLTTMEVQMHRFVLAEFNTHRMFSRNSASSRAIPTKKQIERIKTNPAFPVEFGSNQAGMQAGPPIEDLRPILEIWQYAMDVALTSAQKLAEMGVHKQVTNRLLEPFMWHTVIVTGSEWENFFGLRCNPMAQPEIKAAADLMKEAYDSSTPSLVDYGEWHTPYIDEDTAIDVVNSFPDWRKTLTQISAARCARVSYLTHDGKRDIDKDLELYDRLTTEIPPHASPLEHVATPASLLQEYRGQIKGNFRGWHQLRHWGSK